MDDNLVKLAALGSDSILSTPYQLEIAKLSHAGLHARELWELLNLKNGFYSFESALHVFPVGSKTSVVDINSWNSNELWRNDYGQLAQSCFFFAEDVFGSQFCFKDGLIQTFHPETGGTQRFSEDLGSWARLILENYELHTGYPLAHKWQGEHGPLQPGFRLVPKIPFVLGGPYSTNNLYSLDSVQGMRLRASIALQIKDVPDGTPAKLRVSR